MAAARSDDPATRAGTGTPGDGVAGLLLVMAAALARRRPDLHTNFVLVVSDGKELHRDTLYHLGVAVADKAAVVRAYELAKAAGLVVNKPPRTTWHGTPLHELWLEDPDGNLVEVYARLTADELANKPENREPTALA